MRKLGFSLFSCIALVAFMGLSGTALAAVDPSCDGDPYPNDPGIHDFAIDTPDSQLQHAVSGVRGSGVACGTDTADTDTFYDQADVKTAPGVEVNGTSGIATGRFVGTANVNVAVNAFGGLYQAIYEDVASVMSIEPLSSCQNETIVGGPIPGTIIACYKGVNPQGYNYNIVTAGDDGRTWLTIARFHPPLGTAGLTDIKQFNLCGYVGAAGGTQYPADCGDSSQPFLQRNGHASYPNCENGNGIYSVTATNRGGATTAPATACVEWNTPPTRICLQPLPLPARTGPLMTTEDARRLGQKPQTGCLEIWVDPTG